MSRSLILLMLGAGLALGVPEGATAKGTVRARLTAPIPADAAPGTKIRVAWTLMSHDGTTRRPFGAGGVFIRLHGGRGSSPREAEVWDGVAGKFAAEVEVPAGGITKVEIGLRGWRQRGSGQPWEPADEVFPIDGQILRQPRDAPPARWLILLALVPGALTLWWLRRRAMHRVGSSPAAA